jgi:TonB family protein
MSQRKKRNSSKVNLVFSIIFHSLLVLGLFYFAAREGFLGKHMKSLMAEMVKKEKPPEPPKEKPQEQKVEPPKPLEPPKVATAPPPPALNMAAPPPADTAPAMAPPAVNLAQFEFNDGAKAVESVSDPNLIYKATIERSLRARWNRPEDMSDDTYVAEVELRIDPAGKVTDSRWIRGSGNTRWDNAVKAAVAATRTIGTPPPKGFPGTFKARFDVEAARTEEVIQMSQVVRP